MAEVMVKIMDTKILQEVLLCLCGERTLFHYGRDQYAVDLIKRQLAANDSLAVREIKSSRWAPLLNKPVLRKVIAECGDGYLYRYQLEALEGQGSEPFVLTLGQWGESANWSWAQTSRPGGNLVLQLNVSRNWSRAFERLVKESANERLGYSHPVSHSRNATLAWARLDFDFETDEVLIEEIQSDLIRWVQRLEAAALHAKADGKTEFHNYLGCFNTEQAMQFCEGFISTFKRTWHEAMLAAAVEFSFDELGFSKLYYHSFETGAKMKNISYTKPPRSLYTDLPKMFCFTPTQTPPAFLQSEKKLKRKIRKLGGGHWYQLSSQPELSAGWTATKPVLNYREG